MRGTRTSIIAGAAAALMLTVSNAQADRFSVTKRSDPAPQECKKRDCSLREAIIAANAAPGPDRVTLPSTKPYRLARASTGEDGALDGDLDVANAPLRIGHEGRGRATVDANGIDRAFEIFGGAPTTISDLRITGGAQPSSLDGLGGGIRTDANLKLVRSSVVGNRAAEPEAIAGGIYVAAGKLTLVRSSVSRNRADDESGAIEVESDAGVSIRRSLLSKNRSGFAGVGYWYGAGEYRIVKSTIAGNRSSGETGSIYFSSNGSLRALGTTFSDNVAADDGGGFTARNGDVTFVNSTFSGNRAGGSGGGVWALTPVHMNSVTVARNVAAVAGGGLYVLGTTPVEVQNSLVALNLLEAGDRSDCASEMPATAFVSLGDNLISSTGPADACTGFAEPGDLVVANPRIGKLRRNGGPTKTIALKRGSAGLNAANSATAPARDQRGVTRRRPDIGAFELRPK